jgi:hypothetical protein
MSPDHTKYYKRDRIEDEMGEACTVHEGDEIHIAYRILVGNLKLKDHLGDLGVDGRIILNTIFKKCGISVSKAFKWMRIWSSGRLL